MRRGDLEDSESCRAARSRTKFDEEGYFILEIPFTEEHELIMDILRFGPDVEVLEPTSLRQSVSKKIIEMIAVYN